MNRGTEALEYANKCVESDASYAKGHLRKGQALVLLKQIPESHEAFKQAALLAPDDKVMKKGLRLSQKRLDEYIPDLDPEHTKSKAPSANVSSIAASSTKQTNRASTASANVTSEKVGQVKPGNGTDSDTVNIVNKATIAAAEMTKQDDAAKMAIQPQQIVLQTAANEDGNTCSKVIHEAHVAAEQNAVMKATFVEQKRVTEEKALEESLITNGM